jgi:hypothetical protein
MDDARRELTEACGLDATRTQIHRLLQDLPH